MKLLHLSDLHIGKIVNSFNMLEDQSFALKGILELISEHQVDVVLLAGDIYDKATPSAEAVHLVDWFLTELVKHKVAVIGVPGNHDSAERIAYAQGILQEQGVFFPPLYDGHIKSVTLEDEFGPVTFWLLPFLKPAMVRPFFPEEDIQTDYTRALECALSHCEINKDERNILIAHQFVTATGSETQRSASELNLGGVDNVDASIFDDFDYVALGHIHRPQRIGRDTCRYAGSLLKYSLSEALQNKSAVLIELKAKTNPEGPGNCLNFKLAEYPIKRDLRSIKGPLDELTDETKFSKSDDYIHAVLTDEVVPLNAQARLRTIYPNLMSFTKEHREASPNTESSSPQEDIESIEPTKLFTEFFLKQTGKEINDEQARLVEQLLNESIQNTNIKEA